MARISSLCILLILGVLSCKKDHWTQFNHTISSETTISSAIQLSTPVDIITPPIATNSQSTFETNNTRKDLIEGISLTEIKAELITPQGADFSFLESIKVFLSTNGLPDLKIAENLEIDSNSGASIIISGTGAEIKDYLTQDVVSLRMETVTDEIITEDHQLKIDATFLVDAKILGQ